MKKTLQDLTIKDSFMFAAVMSDPIYCQHFLSLLLEMDILDVSVIPEKTMVYHPEYHGVRLDVLAEEKGTKRRFNVEMQIKAEKNLPKRSRYYHAQIDMDSLLTGEKYKDLPDTFVIFICDYDPLGLGLYKYSLRTCCLENGNQIEDGVFTYWLSTKGCNDSEISTELLYFLKYVEKPDQIDKIMASDFVTTLEKKINSIKQDHDWEAKFMLLKELLEDERKSGYDEGLNDGIRQGLSEGINQGYQRNIIKILSYKDEISPKTEAVILKENDPDTLEQWSTFALESSSVQEFMQKIME